MGWRGDLDYYTFGAPLPGRNNPGTDDYRYGFNGKENDSETGTQDYGFRIYNPSLGKFLSVDPLSPDYPELTPYQFASNSPIELIDIDGLEGGHCDMAGSEPHLQQAAREDGYNNVYNTEAFRSYQAANEKAFFMGAKYTLFIVGFYVAGPIELGFMIPNTGLTVGKDIASIAPEKFPGAANAPGTVTGAIFHIGDTRGNYTWQNFGDFLDAGTWAASGFKQLSPTKPFDYTTPTPEEYIDISADFYGALTSLDPAAAVPNDPTASKSIDNGPTYNTIAPSGLPSSNTTNTVSPSSPNFSSPSDILPNVCKPNSNTKTSNNSPKSAGAMPVQDAAKGGRIIQEKYRRSLI